MPPKRSPADSTTPAPATNFFTRGAKPTTTQRIVNAKKASFAPTPTVAPKKVQHQDEDKDEEDEVSDVVSDEIEQVDTDEDVQVYTPRQQEKQQLDLERQQHLHEDDNEDQDEYESPTEEIEQSDEDQEDSDAPTIVRPTRATAAKAAAGLKKTTVVKPAAAAKVTKPTLPTRSSAVTKNKKKAPAPYVAVDVGDIHRGFHQSDLSDNEKMLRQFDLASQYGPCTDMTRLERWERAFTLVSEQGGVDIRTCINVVC
ncbi:hypothetical protein EC991_005863 [Linnemannia zychae]|nr:hypothetical protein EC991_005863 [Linnemannia zychae]